MLAQYIRNKGFQEGHQEGHQQGHQQGRQQASIMFLNRLLTKKYHVSSERLAPRLKGLSSEELLELGERILDCDSFEDIQGWIRQKKQGRPDA